MGRGRYKMIGSPEILLQWWDEYKANVDANPDRIEEATGKGVMVRKVKKPYLRQGFEAWCFRNKKLIIHQYIDNYDNKYVEFMGVVTCMRKEWEDDQIGGTMTGRYKAPNLTARLNGITDNQNTKTEGIQKITIERISQDKG
jgi:hypothetical protein